MKKKYFVIVAIVGFILASYFVFRPVSSPQTPKKIVNTEPIVVLLDVDYDSLKASVSGEVKVNRGETALVGLKKSHEVETKHYSFGDLVEVIDGVSGGDGKYWIYYVNGKSAKVGASQYVLKTGDKILWRLEAEKN